MTLTIDLAPELEERLRREAAAHGMEAIEYVQHLIQERLPPAPMAGAPARAAAVEAALGRYRHLPTSSDAYSREKQQEMDWEDRR